MFAVRSRGQLAYYSTHSFICQELFSSFFKFFRDVFQRPSLEFSVAAALADSLDILAHPLPFVNTFFHLFFIFSVPGQQNVPKRSLNLTVEALCSRYLSSRAVTRQVLSAYMSLTSVFGMGTGGPS